MQAIRRSNVIKVSIDTRDNELSQLRDMFFMGAESTQGPRLTQDIDSSVYLQPGLTQHAEIQCCGSTLVAWVDPGL